MKEVASVTALPPGKLEPKTIAFTDHKGEEFADPVTGLVRFEDWERAKPLQKQLLSLHPAYVEPTINVTLHGVTKPLKRKLHVYTAEARFLLPKSPGTVDPAHFVSLAFAEKVDPAIKQRVISAAEAIPNKDPEAAYNRHPDRSWCETKGHVICLQSRYNLEGKLPTGIRLANKLEEGPKKIAEFIEFQSELRALSPGEVDGAALAKLTGLETAVTGVLEQSTFHVNQILSFGKFLAVFQAHPGDPNATVVTAFMALGIKSDVLGKKKEFENVPVLRNLVPAQVLVGSSSFNTGDSISAGLPRYARNRMQRIPELLN